jgi:hypothetical protein
MEFDHLEFDARGEPAGQEGDGPMRVEQHMEDIARTQGWSDKSQLIHALTFLDKLVMQGAILAEDFRAYLEHIRAEENEVARRAEDSGT